MENENTSHTARKTVAKMNMPRFVPSEISPFDTPAIQAIVREKPSARSIATADVHPRIRSVSRYATTAGSVGVGVPGAGIRKTAWKDSVPTNTRAPRRIPESSTSVFIETPRGGMGGGVGYGAYAGGGAAGPGACKPFLLLSGWRVRSDKGFLSRRWPDFAGRRISGAKT